MKRENKKQVLQNRDYILPGIVFVLVSVVLASLFLLIERQIILDDKIRYQYIAANQSGLLENSVDVVLTKADTLRSLLRIGDGSTDFFEEEAPEIYQEAREESGIILKNIAVAPGGVVEKVYPFAGNESLIGFDFMDVSRPGNAEAVAAYQKGALVLTQPFDLVQGGKGMAGRAPVFMERDGNTEFWGLVTVTMDFDTLLENFHLQNLTDMGIAYRLWYRADDGSVVSLAESKEQLTDPAGCEFSMRNLTWHLDLMPVGGWVDYSKIALEMAVVLVFAALMSLILLDKAKLHRVNEKLERLANLDSLTMCCSRHYVNMVLLNQRTGKWNDPQVKYSVAMLDIDCFKSINDTYGHEIGDRAIVAVAQVLMDFSKSENGDCVIRHGGDEFVLLFNDVTLERFTEKLRSIVEAVRAIRFTDVPDLRLTVSIGGEQYVSPEQSLYYGMLERADQKLYEAKENGRNQFRI